MEDFLKIECGLNPTDGELEHNVSDIHQRLESCTDEIKVLQQQAYERLQQIKEKQQHRDSVDKRKSQNIKSLEVELQLLRRATNLKFTGPNAGVLLHKGKAKQFVVPGKGNKYQTVNDLWGLIKPSD